MAWGKLAERTWTEIRAIGPGRTILIVPVGAVEAHGPHLPLDTDGLIAESMAAAAVPPLEAAGYDVLVLPTVRYTPAGFAAGFPGTVSVDVETATALLLAIGRAAWSWRPAALAIANAHLDPDNLRAIHSAVATLREEGAKVAFPDLTRKPWALRLGEEFRSGACHAGRYEGSMVLAARPDLVRGDVADSLPENPASLSDAIRDGKADFSAAGGAEAYFGDPAAATAEEGERRIAELGAILAEAVLAELE